MQTQATSLHSTDIADVLDAAFHLYRRHLWIFFLTALICFLPFIAIVWLPLDLSFLGMWEGFVLYGTLVVCYTVATWLLTGMVATMLHQPTEIMPTLHAKLPRTLGLFFMLLLPNKG